MCVANLGAMMLPKEFSGRPAEFIEPSNVVISDQASRYLKEVSAQLGLGKDRVLAVVYSRRSGTYDQAGRLLQSSQGALTVGGHRRTDVGDAEPVVLDGLEVFFELPRVDERVQYCVFINRDGKLDVSLSGPDDVPSV